MYLMLVLVILSVLNVVFGQYDPAETPTRTYDLQVPGSDPIRIIEAEPLWERDHQEIIITTSEKPWTELEHRALRQRPKTSTFETKTNIQTEENETEDTATDSSEELKKFLKEYAEKLRRTTNSPIEDNNHEDFSSSERFHKVELITKPAEEPTNRLANLFLENQSREPGDFLPDDKSKAWNLLSLQRNKNPVDDKNGWVSLEVVPWSVSKVAKWHSDHIKPNVEAKPWENKYSDHSPSSSPKPWDNQYSDHNPSSLPKPWENKYLDHRPNPWGNTNPIVAKPIWNQSNKPLINYRPGSTNYHAKPFNYGNVDNKPNPRPAFSVPSTSFAQKVYIQQDHTDEVPRPSWNKNPQNVYGSHHVQEDDPNCDEHGHLGIITDGLPPNFPKPHHEHNRRKGSVSNEEHPSSHPFNGEGEWVLLTTTKGYKAPNEKQRSLDIDFAADDLDKESISTHKSIRLTVLPPAKDSKINMTTSHGGLLQVESTFQTVDEAQKMSLKKEKMKRRPVKRRPLKQTAFNARPTANTNSAVTPTVNTRKKIPPNASSVLAAVGAGMIPATMAMLVPMAMGRRRRRDLIFSTRSPNMVGLELQLPRSY